MKKLFLFLPLVILTLALAVQPVFAERGLDYSIIQKDATHSLFSSENVRLPSWNGSYTQPYFVSYDPNGTYITFQSALTSFTYYKDSCSLKLFDGGFVRANTVPIGTDSWVLKEAPIGSTDFQLSAENNLPCTTDVFDNGTTFKITSIKSSYNHQYPNGQNVTSGLKFEMDYIVNADKPLDISHSFYNYDQSRANDIFIVTDTQTGNLNVIDTGNRTVTSMMQRDNNPQDTSSNSTTTSTSQSLQVQNTNSPDTIYPISEVTVNGTEVDGLKLKTDKGIISYDYSNAKPFLNKVGYIVNSDNTTTLFNDYVLSHKPLGIGQKVDFDPVLSFKTPTQNYVATTSTSVGTVCGSPSSIANTNTIFLTDQVSNDVCKRIAYQYNIAPLTNAIIDNVILTLDSSNTFGKVCNINADLLKPSTLSATDLWNSIGNGTNYVPNSTICSVSGTNYAIPLGSNAISDLQSKINSGNTTFAVAIKYADETRDAQPHTTTFANVDLTVYYHMSTPSQPLSLSTITHAKNITINYVKPISKGSSSITNYNLYRSSFPFSNIPLPDFQQSDPLHIKYVNMSKNKILLHMDSLAGSVVNETSGNRYNFTYHTIQNVTGGTLSLVGSDEVRSFTTSGTFTTSVGLTAQVLVVGGGGQGNGGAGCAGGGGAGGGFGYNSAFSIPVGTYSVLVGGYSSPTGGTSTFSSISEGGGGNGGGCTTTGNGGASPNGSGGGGAVSNAGATQAGGAGTGTGHNGASGAGGACINGGGGGGSTSAGSSGTGACYTGFGGSGTSNSITGSPVTYAGGGQGGAGTGSGGGNGGAGIVIIRYPQATSPVVSGVFSNGLNFTGSNSWLDATPSSTLLSGTNPFTVGVWSKFKSTTTPLNLVTFQQSLGATKLQVNGSYATVNVVGIKYSACALTRHSNSWNYDVFTYNGTHYSIYNNGTLLCNVASTGGVGTPVNNTLIIGAEVSKNNNYKGVLDEYELTSKARNSTEIANIYARSVNTYNFIKQVGNVTSITDTGLANGATWYYQVNAKNTQGNGTLSAPVFGTSATVPTAPSHPISSGLSTTSLILRWTAPNSTNGDPISGYQIRQLTSTNSWVKITNNTGTSIQNYNVTGKSVGSLYTFIIAAWNGAGLGTNSSQVIGTTLPNNPTSLITSVIKPTGLTLNWGTPVNGNATITDYGILRSLHGTQSFITIQPHTGNTTNRFMDTGLSPDTKYVYQAKTNNAGGSSSVSNNATTGTAFNAPTSLIANPILSPIGMNVSWAAPTPINDLSILGYQISRNNTIIVNNTGTLTRQYLDSPLTQSRTQTYSIGAWNIYALSPLGSVSNSTFSPTTATSYINYTLVGNMIGVQTRVNVVTGSPTPVATLLQLYNGSTLLQTKVISHALPAGNITTYIPDIFYQELSNISPSNLKTQITVTNGSGTVILTSNQTGSKVAQYIPSFKTNNGYTYNYTASRTDGFTNIHLQVNRVPVNFRIECHYYISPFDTGIWFNYSDTALYSKDLSVPSTTTYYVTCWNDSPIFSVTFYGDYNGTTLINSFTKNFGSFLGLPSGSIAFIFVIFFAAIFTGRSAPTGIIMIAIAVGVMWYMHFIPAIPSIVWAFVIASAIMGMLAGKKIF